MPSLEEHVIELRAELTAHHIILVNLFSGVLLERDDPLGRIDRITAHMMREAAKLASPRVSPAMSDHVAALVQEKLEKVLQSIRQVIEQNRPSP